MRWQPAVGRCTASCELVPRQPLDALASVAELGTCVAGPETPLDSAASPIRVRVPARRSTAQLTQARDSVTTVAFACPKTYFDLGRVEPAPVLGCVVHTEAR